MDSLKIDNNLNYKPLLIGVTGGTASGKTSLCKYLLNTYLFFSIITLTLLYKNYWKSWIELYLYISRLFLQRPIVFNHKLISYSEKDHNDAENYNFDHPNALDFDCAYDVIKELLAGRNCEIPIYDFTLHAR